MRELPKVGTAVFVVRDKKILLGKRKGSHGAGSWSLPGGHLEMFESWEDCVVRETFEETSLSITNVRFLAVTNDIFWKENKHFITLFLVADYGSGEAVIMEPDKCRKWAWFEWDMAKLPCPLFVPLQNFIGMGYSPF